MIGLGGSEACSVMNLVTSRCKALESEPELPVSSGLFVVMVVRSSESLESRMRYFEKGMAVRREREESGF